MSPTPSTFLYLAAICPLSAPQADFDRAAATRFAELALACVHREYPNQIQHVLNSDADAQPPRQLTPAFFGCYDWHSAVHAHWLLARLCRHFPGAPFESAARLALQRSLTAENLAAEAAYLRGTGRETFERPYGLAWLLQLCAELREWDDAQARTWSANLEALEREAAQRLRVWLPKLSHPIRTGEHSQTAFAMGLILDWGAVAKDVDLSALVRRRCLDFYARDSGWSLAFEPGGQDFFSPGLAEADLMRRVLAQDEFALWLGLLLPEIPRDGSADWLPVAVVTDKTDGKLAHLDGLNLSRAWMLEGIARALPPGDARRPALAATAAAQRRAGLAAVTGEHYEGGHWLGSFAVYLVTQRGLAVQALPASQEDP